MKLKDLPTWEECSNLCDEIGDEELKKDYPLESFIYDNEPKANNNLDILWREALVNAIKCSKGNSMKWFLISDRDIKKIQNEISNIRKTVVTFGETNGKLVRINYLLDTGLHETNCITGDFKENENDTKTVVFKAKH